MLFNEIDGKDASAKHFDTFIQSFHREKISLLSLVRVLNCLLLMKPAESCSLSSQNCVNVIEKRRRSESRLAISTLVFVIKMYQRLISPLLPPACRFDPTCSEYSCQALTHFGLWTGLWKSLSRVCRCHPFNSGGIDPVV